MASREKKEKEQRKQDKIKRFVYLSLLRSLIKLTDHPSYFESLHLKQPMSTPASTMDVSSYSPTNSQLNLGSPHTIQQLANSVSPLFYKLTPNDFTTFRIRDEIMCALDESIGVALLFTLQRLERYIVNAGHYRILDHISPSSVNLHSVQFDELNLPRPAVLLVSEFRNQHNPLFFLTSMQDLQTMHASLQLVGREAMDWISTAKARASQIGPACSWNFEDGFTRPSISPSSSRGIDRRARPLISEGDCKYTKTIQRGKTLLHF